MGKSQYTDIEAGWIWPDRNNFRLACCRCGDIHRIKFRVQEGQIQIKVDVVPGRRLSKKSLRK